MTHAFSTSHAPARPASVPQLRLYVDRQAREQWFVHVGHVSERGRWKTEPHAHPGYGQVIFVRQGRGVMNLEGRSLPFDSPCALLLPAQCVHGLDYTEDIDRWVVTIDVAYLNQVNAKLPEFSRLWSAPRLLELDDVQDFQRMVQRLAGETSSRALGHVAGVESLLTTLLLALVRLAPADHDKEEGDGGSPGNARLADRFRALVERHYHQKLSLQGYASMMAVSPAQLRSACAAATGHSPTKLIHARIIAEAKRNLIFGHLPVEGIAWSLGFADAGYFTRFFRREVGQTPGQFREEALRRQV